MWAFVLAGALASSLATSVEFAAHTSDGHITAGTLLELAADRVVLQTSEGQKTLPTQSVASIAARTSAAVGKPIEKPHAWIELVDGTILRGSNYRVAKGKAHFDLAGAASQELSTRDIVSIRFHEQSPEVAKQWTEVLEAERPSDVVVLQKNNVLDYLNGVLGDAREESIDFELDGELVPVKWAKIEGLLYAHPAGRELPAAFCVVVDRAGSRFQVQTATVADQDLKLTTPAGVQVTLPMSKLAAIEFKIQYLSDLKPESMDWRPFFGSSAGTKLSAPFYRPRFNRGLERAELRLGEKTYAKGLALHSRTEIVFRLPEKFRSFKCVAGLDDLVRPAGDVRLVIHGDEKELLDIVLSGKDEPRPIDLDLTGVKRLKILVDFGGDLDVADHLNLCDARLLK
jgi:hypothetical protein